MRIYTGSKTLSDRLEGLYPGHFGYVVSPLRGGWRLPTGTPYFLENGCYSAWSKNTSWNPVPFLTRLLQCAQQSQRPEWVVVPDSVGNASETFHLWQQWSRTVRASGLKTALAVQNGMDPNQVRKLTDPDIIFVGGTYDWKIRTIPVWTANFPHVHVGRINRLYMLNFCHTHGVQSIDGSAWHHFQKEAIQFIQTLDTQIPQTKLQKEDRKHDHQ